MKKRFFAMLLVVVMLVSVLGACSKKDENPEPIKDPFADELLGENDAAASSKDAAGKDSNSSKDSVLYDDNSAEYINKENENDHYVGFPAEAGNSVLFERAVEMPDAAYMPDAEELKGEVYYVEGTVVKMLDVKDFTKELAEMELEDVPEDLLKELEENIKVFSLESRLGPVVVVDALPYFVKTLNDFYKDDLYSLKSLKVRFDNLKLFSTFPEVGEKARIYCNYADYSEKLDCPMVSYGLSMLVYQNLFQPSYSRYRSEQTKKCKYKNLIDFEIPKAWSEVLEAGDVAYYYFADGSVAFDYLQDPDEEADIEELVENMKEYYFAYDFYDFDNTDENGEPTFNSEAYDMMLESCIKSEEYTTLYDTGKECYRLSIAIPYSENVEDMYIVAFRHKHMLVLVTYRNFSPNSDDSELFFEDFENILKSISPRSM